MLLELQGATHRVKFRHYNPLDAKNQEFVKDGPEGKLFGTEAILERTLPTSEGQDTAWEPIAAGCSFLHPMDMKRYDKETGRKIAFGRALSVAFPDEAGREVRKRAWEAYLNRPRVCNPPKAAKSEETTDDKDPKPVQ